MPYNGQTTMILGAGGAGKTSLARDFIEEMPCRPSEGAQNFVDGKLDPYFANEVPHIWICPEPMNPEIEFYPHWTDSDADLDDLEKRKLLYGKNTLAIYVEENNPRLFKMLYHQGLVVVIDEATVLSKETETKKPFLLWARKVRARDQQAIYTTHRPVDDFPPTFYRNVAKKIYWVGPQTHPDEIQELWYLKDAKNPITYEEFKDRIEHLELYDYRRKNFESSVMLIKGGTYDAPHPKRDVQQDYLDQGESPRLAAGA